MVGETGTPPVGHRHFWGRTSIVACLSWDKQLRLWRLQQKEPFSSLLPILALNGVLYTLHGVLHANQLLHPQQEDRVKLQAALQVRFLQM